MFGLFRALTEKPWVRSPQTPEGLTVESAQATTLPPQKIALLFFLCVVGVVFGLFITAYFIRMELDDWRPLPESNLLWVNTALLFGASIALQWTQHLIKHSRPGVGYGLLAGAVLTLAFVFGQYGAWQEMRAAGYYLASNPASSFFYVLTGLHALHVLGGLWVWLRAGFRLWSGAEPEAILLSVELCSVYWHFLLLVWLVLFGLLSYT
jgi:cytochrome c oxidase subunit III